mmetsp:Transcript_53749/g.61726  ORF Transcript_53749/g.61726 Transcript_53749/m.61726 type:complete len:549 (+) Transcript_53749:2-1648(+)
MKANIILLTLLSLVLLCSSHVDLSEVQDPFELAQWEVKRKNRAGGKPDSAIFRDLPPTHKSEPTAQTNTPAAEHPQPHKEQPRLPVVQGNVHGTVVAGKSSIKSFGNVAKQRRHPEPPKFYEEVALLTLSGSIIHTIPGGSKNLINANPQEENLADKITSAVRHHLLPHIDNLPVDTNVPMVDTTNGGKTNMDNMTSSTDPKLVVEEEEEAEEAEKVEMPESVTYLKIQTTKSGSTFVRASPLGRVTSKISEPDLPVQPSIAEEPGSISDLVIETTPGAKTTIRGKKALIPSKPQQNPGNISDLVIKTNTGSRNFVKSSLDEMNNTLIPVPAGEDGKIINPTPSAQGNTIEMMTIETTPGGGRFVMPGILDIPKSNSDIFGSDGQIFTPPQGTINALVIETTPGGGNFVMPAVKTYNNTISPDIFGSDEQILTPPDGSINAMVIETTPGGGNFIKAGFKNENKTKSTDVFGSDRQILTPPQGSINARVIETTPGGANFIRPNGKIINSTRVVIGSDGHIFTPPQDRQHIYGTPGLAPPHADFLPLRND